MNSIGRKLSLVKTCLQGFKEFEDTGTTPEDSYLAMRQLFVQTNGWFNDIFQYFYGITHRPVPLPSINNSLFKTQNFENIKQAVTCIERDGYYVFPELIPSNLLDEMHDHSMRVPSALVYDAYADPDETAVFNPSQLVAPLYRLSQEDTINDSAVQQFMADPVLLEIATRYFKSQASYCIVHMWWTTPFGCDNPSSRLAQQYHFDMDRVKFLNFFVYLTDVGPEDGPHCFIRGSHRRKPKQFLEDRRFSDEEIASHYGPEDHIEITGPRGTVMAVDGRGFHKAKMPTRGNRLILLSSMSSSLFGQSYPRERLDLKSDAMRSAVAADPRITCSFDVKEPGVRSLVQTT